MIQWQMQTIPRDTPLYRFYLIEDYSENESIFVIMCNHSIGDGMAISSFFLALGDSYDCKNLPNLKFMNPFVLFALYALYPFLTLYYTLKLLFFTSKDQNSIANNKPLSKNKNAFTSEISIDDIKKLAKLTNTTVNNATMGLLSLSFSEYFKKIKETEQEYSNFDIPKKLWLLSPVSIRSPAKRVD